MQISLTRFEALKLAIIRAPAKGDYASGTQEALAAHLGVSQPAVSRWVNCTKQMPAEHVLKTEAMTGVSRHDLRPDIYPREAERFYGVDRDAHRSARRHPLGQAA